MSLITTGLWAGRFAWGQNHLPNGSQWQQPQPLQRPIQDSVSFGRTAKHIALARMEEHQQQLISLMRMGGTAFERDPMAQDAALHQLVQLGTWARDLQDRRLLDLAALRDHAMHHPAGITPHILWENLIRIKKVDFSNPRQLNLIFPKRKSLPDVELCMLAQERMRRIAAYLEHVHNQSDFNNNPRLRDAIAYNLEVIGEASRVFYWKEMEQNPVFATALNTLREIRNHLAHPEQFPRAQSASWLWQQLCGNVLQVIETLQAYFARPAELALTR